VRKQTRSVRLEIKAAADPISTTSGRSIVRGPIGAIIGSVQGFQNALSVRNSPKSSAAECSRFTGTQGAAAVQATEGADKAAVRPDHSLIVQSAVTIAGYSKMSREALSDSEELRRAVDVTQGRSVGVALDEMLVNGVAAFTGFEAPIRVSSLFSKVPITTKISKPATLTSLAGFSFLQFVRQPGASGWLLAPMACRPPDRGPVPPRPEGFSAGAARHEGG